MTTTTSSAARLLATAAMGALLIVGFGCGPKKTEVRANLNAEEKTEAKMEKQEPRQLEVTLAAVGTSGVKGKAVLIEQGDKTMVMFNLEGEAQGGRHPAHLHVGSCPVPGAVKWALTDAVEGKSTTLLDVKFDDIRASLPLALNVHKSGTELGVYLVCGDLLASKVMTKEAGVEAEVMAEAVTKADVTLKTLGALGASGTATIWEEGGKVKVSISMTGGPGGTNPAHIHLGSCPTPGEVKHSLSAVVGGKSETTLDTTLATLMASGKLSINVHKSPTEIPVYLACGDLPAWDSAKASFMLDVMVR